MLSCRRAPDVPPVPDEPSLGVTVSFPVSSPTKSDVGTLPASDAENALHSLSIWVFNSETQARVTYRSIPEADFPVAGGVRRYSLPVTREFANTTPNVDVFVLANGASVGCDLGEDATWQDLNSASFGKGENEDYFGLENPVKAVDPALGLPISGVGYNMAVQGDAPILSLETITLRRAVSRLRFVFCKTKTEGEEDVKEVSIRNITLSGLQIPKREYVFASTASGIVYNEENTQETYIPEAFTLVGPPAVAENETPENYIYVNQDPVSYEQLLNDAVAAGTLTDMGNIYFRESDKRLIGWIEYQVGDVVRTREFSMATAGDFTRNHTWTLLGFFLSGRNVQLALSVLPWDMNSYNVNYTDEVVMVTSPFSVEESSASITWKTKDDAMVRLIPGKSARGFIRVVSPVGGRLMIKPEGDVDAFTVSPEYGLIDPGNRGGMIEITVARNAEYEGESAGKQITLSFSVEIGERTISANSEAINHRYTFVL